MRNHKAFQRFLEVAALTDGEMVNNNNIATDCGVSATTVSSYFDILEDTLIGYRIPAFQKVMPKHLKGLKAFGEEHPQSRKIIVSLDRINRRIGDTECMYVLDFFKTLWSKGI